MITFKNLGKKGRFGNQLFEIASTIGLATSHQIDFGFPKWRNYEDSWHNFFPRNMQKYFLNPLPKMLKCSYRMIHVDWGYHDLKLEDWCSLDGYFQSWRYFHHCEELIRHYFELKSLSKMEIPQNCLAIHMRLGDYDGSVLTNLDIEYYTHALSYFDKSQPIMVFSDDIVTARAIFDNNKYIYVEGNDYMVDFYLMTKCSHFIIANSTFSWWAAWLSKNPGKKVIAPNNWFNPKTGLDTSDLYHPSWLVL